MGLKIISGPSGSGKSRYLYDEIIRESMQHPDRQFFVIVPDQFSMSTAREICRLHPRGGIMNIDVLSFTRLAHRIGDEVGRRERVVLDDTGKNLILRRIALSMEDDLTFLKGRMKSPGYVHEVKSQISEFYQYDIGTDSIDDIIEKCSMKGYLKQKLSDLKLLYTGFSDYIKDKFITSEEILSELCDICDRSKLLAGSTIVFDDFTGFTPIQLRVITKLLKTASSVSVTLLCDGTIDDGADDLFRLTKRSYSSLVRAAERAGEKSPEIIYLPKDNPGRHLKGSPLYFLERNLLRFNGYFWKGSQDAIEVTEARSMRDEVTDLCRRICDLKRKGYQFREIAVETGDLEGYGPILSCELARYGIPFYMDRPRTAFQNPFVTLIRCLIKILSEDFSYSSVCGLLRCGLLPFEKDETDRFDLYLMRMGIRGRNRYMHAFEYGKDADEADKIRERLMEMLACLLRPFGTAREFTLGIYEFLTQNKMAEVLYERARFFDENGQPALAGEYEKIYASIMELLDSIYELIGDDQIDAREYLAVFEAGASEIRIGTIPQSVDQVMVGDMQRTRLEPVKALFFIGVNDGIIPRRNISGGLLSDMEKEYLRREGMELSPGPKDKMYEQRLYLYQNMTKPGELIHLSYAAMDSEGKSMSPSYLINEIRVMFPDLEVNAAAPADMPAFDDIREKSDGINCMASMLGSFMASGADRGTCEKDFGVMKALAGALGKDDFLRKLTEIAAYRYIPGTLGKDLSGRLYDQGGTISRLELMASCPFAHFLRYGLRLTEKDEYEFDFADLGNIYHAVLEQVMSGLDHSGKDICSISSKELEELVHETLLRVCRIYKEQILYSSERNEYKIIRMERVLVRTLLFMRERLKKGGFKPFRYEQVFNDKKGRMLRGKIDRIDIAQRNDRIYVKVVDYKSSDKSLCFTRIGNGLSLQLPIYLGEAVLGIKEKMPDKDVIPAAMLYASVKDPIIKDVRTGEEEKGMMLELRPSGLFLGDSEVLALLDKELEPGGRSDVIRGGLKTDGSLTQNSQGVDADQMNGIVAYAQKKADELLSDIQNGDIGIVPKKIEGIKYDSCEYCGYRGICGFDLRVNGFEKKECKVCDIEDLTAENREAE